MSNIENFKKNFDRSNKESYYRLGKELIEVKIIEK